MSVYDSKANYHPVSTLPGSLPNGKSIYIYVQYLIHLYSFYAGSYLLPGNGYYRYAWKIDFGSSILIFKYIYITSVEGHLPRLRYDTQKFLNDPKYAYSQSYRIDAMQALRNAKKGLFYSVIRWKMKWNDLNLGTSLPRYYSYYPHFEAARERHIFVPKHFPNENPSAYEHKGLQYFKEVWIENIRLFFMNKLFYIFIASWQYRNLCTS